MSIVIQGYYYRARNVAFERFVTCRFPRGYYMVYREFHRALDVERERERDEETDSFRALSEVGDIQP